MRTAAVVLLALVACGRANELAPRVAETAADTARVAREVDDLRRRVATLEQGSGSGSPATSAAGRDRSIAAEALADGVAAYVAATRSLPAANPSQLVGIWRAKDEVLHLADGGRLCGWRAIGGERRPLWGTWRTRGPLLLELHDRWVGDHNETDALVRDVSAQQPGAFVLSPGNVAFSRAAPGDTDKLASLYDDRLQRIPGLPDWCLR